MKKYDFAYFSLLVVFPLTAVLFPFLSGCTPAEVRISEEVVEEVLEKELDQSPPSKYQKNISVKNNRKVYIHEHKQ